MNTISDRISKIGLTIDHVLIAVRDLQQTAETFNRLGFTVTPEGLHPGRGSRNRLVVFDQEYLELISITDPTLPLFRPNMAEFLSSREGLFIFSIGTTNIQNDFMKFKSRGIDINETLYGARHSSDGDMEYSWIQCEINPLELPGSQTFLIQHDHSIKQRYKVPNNPWIHQNGALGIYNLTLAVTDSEKAANRWQTVFDLEVIGRTHFAGLNANKVSLSFDNGVLDLISPTGPGLVEQFLSSYGESPYSLAIRVSDLDHISQILLGNSIDFEKSELDGNDLIGIKPGSAHGVSLNLIEVY
tara:strand:- start:9726 stop:10625 length:900 start_codon:yes stop_codon:yes gene_type:complete